MKRKIDDVGWMDGWMIYDGFGPVTHGERFFNVVHGHAPSIIAAAESRAKQRERYFFRSVENPKVGANAPRTTTWSARMTSRRADLK
jgi:hypothetical protein